MYYTREIALLWLAYGEVKVLKKIKNTQKKNSEEEEEKPNKRACIRKTIFSAIRKEG